MMTIRVQRAMHADDNQFTDEINNMCLLEIVGQLQNYDLNVIEKWITNLRYVGGVPAMALPTMQWKCTIQFMHAIEIRIRR